MVLMREDEESEDDGAVSVVMGMMSSGCVGLWRSTNPALVEFLDYGNSDVSTFALLRGAGFH